MNQDKQRLMFAPDVLFEAFNEEGVIVDMDGEKVFELNQTGARTVELIAGGHSVDEILSALLEEYSADRAAMKEEISALVQSLLDRGLIVES